MTVGGKVMCRCFLEGRTPPPPVPLDQIRVNRVEGWFYGLDGPGEAFEVWLEGCCPHPNLVAAEFDVSWGRLSSFRRALAAAGAAEYPTLLERLPRTNDGLVLPEIAAVMQAEVREFQGRGVIGLGAFLVDAEDGEDVGGGGPAFEGDAVWVAVSPGYDGGTLVVGYDYDGLFVRPGKAGDEAGVSDVFWGSRAEVRPLGGERAGRYPATAVEYVDVASGVCAVGPKVVRMERGADGTWAPRVVIRLAVERREVTAAEFEDVTHGLVGVCAAAVEFGQPVLWT